MSKVWLSSDDGCWGHSEELLNRQVAPLMSAELYKKCCISFTRKLLSGQNIIIFWRPFPWTSVTIWCKFRWHSKHLNAQVVEFNFYFSDTGKYRWPFSVEVPYQYPPGLCEANGIYYVCSQYSTFSNLSTQSPSQRQSKLHLQSKKVS